MRLEPAPRRGDALLVVDIQNDFLAGGALAVPGGDEVVPVLNRHLALWHATALPIFASRDWHPPDHGSFREQGGPWPPHCIAGTAGARFAAALRLPPETQVVSKGVQRDHDGYSTFDGTDLDLRLRRAGVRRLFIGGLALDYCVLHTVRDALPRGYDAAVLVDAVRAIDADAGARAEREIVRRGAALVRLAPVAA